MDLAPNPRAAALSTTLRLTGRDVLAVLHRISTQFLSDLEPGAVRATLFCDFRGRLLHRAYVARLRDESVWLLRDDAPGAELAAFVDRHVFREEVSIEDWSGRMVWRRRLGPSSEGLRLVEEHGAPARLELGDGAALVRAERETPDAASDTIDWELARVAAGRPRHGHEIAEAFTPFEVGLAREVHLHKGCFTGQEALMRLVTYDSVRRRLARVSGAGAPPATPAELRVAGQPAGVLTSSVGAESGWSGLAVLASIAREPGAALRLEDDRAITGATPFPIERPLGIS